MTVEPFKDSMVGVHMSLVIINQPVGLQYELYSITGGQITTLHLGERGAERERGGERRKIEREWRRGREKDKEKEGGERGERERHKGAERTGEAGGDIMVPERKRGWME